MSRPRIASLTVFVVLAVALAWPPSSSSARRGSRARTAHVALDVTVWERGVSMVHTSRSALVFSLEIGRSDASLHVTGTGRYGTTTLAPGGPGPSAEHELAIDERFRGSVAHDGSAEMLSLVREGTAAIAPRQLEWRCERSPAGVPASHRGALRCIGTAPLDAMPWHNGHWSQVPIVLAFDGPENDIAWDGEGPPIVSVH